MAEALSRDEDGNFKYSIIIWSDIKKSAKSSIAAAVAMWMAETTEWGEIYLIANDLKQADSRVAKYARRAIALNPDLRGRYKTGRGQITSAHGSMIEPIPIDPAGEAGSNADMIQFCFDEETEILTHSGWKRYDDLLMTDAVATQNQDTGEFEWQIPKEVYINDYEGDMLSFESTRMSMKITPNHKIYGRFSGKAGGRSRDNNGNKDDYLSLPWELKTIEEALTYRHIWPQTRSYDWKGIDGYPTEITIESTGYQSEKVIPIELWAKFMGWYLSEGCIKKKKGRPEAVMIGQSEAANPKEYQEIWDMFLEMGLKPSRWKSNDSIVVHHSQLAASLEKFGHSGDKYIPLYLKNCPDDILEIFLGTYIQGDGYAIGEGIAISTKSIKMRDDLEEVSQKCGYGVAHWEYADKRWKGNPVIHTVKLTPLGVTREIKVDPKRWEKVEYKGIVWCPSTENGVVYVRRNGKCVWQGNSELWGAHEEAKEHMWAEMTLSPTKYGQSFRWVESYAGFTEESELLYGLYETGVKDGELLWPDDPSPTNYMGDQIIEAYVNPDARMFCMWNTIPRCPWQTKEYYKSEEAVLSPKQFNRMHRNQWETSEETFVPVEWWRACYNPDLPVVEKNDYMIIAMDAAVSDDHFGLVMVSRHPDRVNRPDDIVTRYARRWKPPKNGKLNFQGTEENPGPERELRRLISMYNVIQVAYDPHQLHDMATRLSREGLAWFREFPQGNDRLESDSMLRSKIRDRRLHHNNEPHLEEHVRNANAKVDDEDRKIRIVKRTRKLKIDLCVALSMATFECVRLNV